jgi:hypothetical protein
LPTIEAFDDVLCRGILFWLGAVLFVQLLFTFTTCGAATLRAMTSSNKLL